MCRVPPIPFIREKTLLPAELFRQKDCGEAVAELKP